MNIFIIALVLFGFSLMFYRKAERTESPELYNLIFTVCFILSILFLIAGFINYFQNILK